MTRPRLLDLYSGAGGCSVGYHRAGFDVVGVDLHQQPNYPYEFVQADALEVLADLWREQTSPDRFARGDFDAIHASPPCQFFSDMRHLAPANGHVDLLTPTRALLERTGLPYVLENVPGSPLRRDYLLCGSMFGLGARCADGKYRQLRRHRWFETNWPVGLQPACDHAGPPIGVYGYGGGGQQRRGYKAHPSEARDAMGIDWMDRYEIAQAIPPAYTELVGWQLRQYLSTEGRVSPDPANNEGQATCSSKSGPRSTAPRSSSSDSS